MKLNTNIELNKSIYEKIFICVLLFSFVVWFGATLLGGPENDGFAIFFSKCDDIFADSSNVIGYSFNRNPYNETYVHSGLERAYPPLTYVMYFIISKVILMNPYIDADSFKEIYMYPPLLIVLIILLLITVILSYEIFRTVKNGGDATKALTALVLILSRPVLFTIERANTLLLPMLLNTIFIFFCDSKNKVLKEVSLLSLAISAALKMTPAVLGILLIYKKQWKDALRTVIYGLFFFFAPFLALKGGFSNIPVFFKNMSLNLNQYANIDGSNLVNRLKFLFPDITSEAFNVANIIYTILCVFILLTIPFMQKDWHKVCGICLILTILPSHSGTYCVLYMIPAVLAFLNEEDHKFLELFAFSAFLMLFIHEIFEFMFVIGLLILFIYMLFISGISVNSKFVAKTSAKS